MADQPVSKPVETRPTGPPAVRPDGAPARTVVAKETNAKPAFDGTVYTYDELVSNASGAISLALDRRVRPADVAGGLVLKGYLKTGATIEQAAEATREAMDREVS